MTVGLQSPPKKVLKACEGSDWGPVMEGWPKAPNETVNLRRDQLRRSKPNVQILDGSGMLWKEVIHTEGSGRKYLWKTDTSSLLPTTCEGGLGSMVSQSHLTAQLFIGLCSQCDSDKADLILGSLAGSTPQGAFR